VKLLLAKNPLAAVETAGNRASVSRSLTLKR
jgi:hypothetical protein